jgi:cysteine desulfurase
MIYFDYAASNPIDPRVQIACSEILNLVGNPSSIHEPGRRLRAALDAARLSVAKLLDVSNTDIFFTSGATEANNLALYGYFKRLREIYGVEQELRLLVSVIEHSSIKENFGRLETELGVIVDRLSVNVDGSIDLQQAKRLLCETTVLVSVMWVNNIIGSRQPMVELGQLIATAREERRTNDLPLIFMSDAVQAMRTEDVQPRKVGVDILTLSGHKMYGPRGIGAIYVRRGVQLAPILTGGRQESGLRAGTENAAGIIGLGRAAELLMTERPADRKKVINLTQELRVGLNQLSSLSIISPVVESTPGIIYVVSDREEGDVFALKLDAAGIAASSGSACDIGTRKTASILQEICSPRIAKRGGVRLSLGKFSTSADVQTTVKVVTGLERARSNNN